MACYCVWDSEYTDYKVTNTPYGKDLLKSIVEAFREEELRVGFYYSLLDWHHPEFSVDRFHPMGNNKEFKEKSKDRSVRKYTEYLRAQVRELLTKFGRIDYIFFDFSYPGEDGKGRDDWQSEKLLKMVRQLQPHILVNDRLDLNDASEIKFSKSPQHKHVGTNKNAYKDTITLQLPVQKPEVTVPVIELFLK